MSSRKSRLPVFEGYIVDELLLSYRSIIAESTGIFKAEEYISLFSSFGKVLLTRVMHMAICDEYSSKNQNCPNNK